MIHTHTRIISTHSPWTNKLNVLLSSPCSLLMIQVKLTLPVVSNLLTFRVFAEIWYWSPDWIGIAPFFHSTLVGGGLLKNGQRKETPKWIPALIGEVGWSIRISGAPFQRQREKEGERERERERRGRDSEPNMTFWIVNQCCYYFDFPPF